MSYTLLAEDTRKARKPHRCTWCHESINPGQLYVDARSVYEGELQADHWHPECYEAMHEAAHEEGGIDEFSPGEYKRGTLEPAGGYAR